jgi:mannosyltransferase OCH1-like enzyme
MIPEFLPKRKWTSRHLNIPRVIVQTMKSRSVPSSMLHAARSWIERNPEYEYRFFDDDAAAAFVHRHFGQDVQDAYDRMPFGAGKADLFRYCFLFLHGGVYADIDTVCLRPLETVLRQSDVFVVPKRVRSRASSERLWNAFMASVPGHPLLKEVIAVAAQNVLSAPVHDDLPHITGPSVLADCARRNSTHPDTDFEVGEGCLFGSSFRLLSVDSRVGLAWDDERADPFLKTKYRQYKTDLQSLGLRSWQPCKFERTRTRQQRSS